MIDLTLTEREVQRLRSALVTRPRPGNEDAALDRKLGDALVAYRRAHPPKIQHVAMTTGERACDVVESKRFVPIHRWPKPVAVGDRCFCGDRIADPILVQILMRT